MENIKSIRESIDRILPTVRKPSRYLGNEKNSVRKDLSTAALTVALCFPDAYEIGMSNIGLQILYHLLNDQPHIAAERVFAPWPDFEAALRENNLPLVSLESRMPLKNFDILGISLPYELTYTNILTILDLAKIPFYAKDRDSSYPLVIGGGNNAFNPEPVADFYDAILVGDGEEAFLEIGAVVQDFKERGQTDKPALLQQLAKIRGVYVPSLFQFHYHEDGRIQRIEPLLLGYEGVQKRSVSDLNQAYYPKEPIVPHTKVIHDRVGVEVQRGCVRGCRFCQAGYIYRPERQRSPETIKDIVRNQIKATGQDEVSLVSLSIGDYDCVSQVMKELMDEHEDKHIGISIPATRVEQLSPAMMTEIKRVRKTGFTIAPEAATERMRRVINKGNSEENFLTTVDEVFKNGWRLMKFYFLVGLPTETAEDVVAIADLGFKALVVGEKYNRKIEINLGVSLFVPKPFTPFQWEPQLSVEEMRDKVQLIRQNLRSRKLRLKPHVPETSYLEGVFSRGDRRLAPAIIKAWEQGARFDEWEECVDFDRWMQAFQACDIDTTFYVERRRTSDEILPWDHLFIEMKKEWLWQEREVTDQEAFIDDCSTGKCTICGVCDYKGVRNRSYEHPVYDSVGKVMKKKTTTEIRPQLFTKPLAPLDRESNQAGFSYLCRFSKKGPATLFGFLELVEHVRRAVSRANLPVRFSEGFHPHPRIKFGDAIKVGREVESEPFTMELGASIAAEEILTRLNAQMPKGVAIQSVIPLSSFLSPKKVALAS